MRTRLLWLGIGIAGALFVALPVARADGLDEEILALMRKRKVPGLSLAVVREGKIARAQGYGVIEAGGTVAVTERTLFQAGSVSKPVAAFGALRLVAAGKLSLDANVNDALKSWKVPESTFTAVEKVTVRRLLNHTAGLTVHGFPGYAVDAARPKLVQMLDGARPANTPPIRVDTVPGAAWRYSGGGYTVLQQLVIDVTGRPYPAVMAETVLAPLQLEASTFEQPLPAARAALTATGHTQGAKPVAGRWHVYPEMAAAGLWSTPSDLARFAIAVQEALAGRPGAALSPETAQLMVTRGEGGYGLGFSVSSSGATERFTHGGRDRGFDTQFTAYREAGLAAVVMININDDSSFMRRVMAAIGRHYDWPAYAPYTPPKAIEDTEPEVTAKLRAVVGDLQRGTFDRALFTDSAAALLTRSLGDENNARDLKDFGRLEAIALVGRRPGDGGARNYRYLLTFERDTATLTCTYDVAGKISAVAVMPE